MKNLKKAIFSGMGIVALTVMAQNSFAQEKQGDKPPKERPTYAQLLEKMDKNKDGKLAESEVDGPLKKDFSKVDTDKDGFITEAEFKKAPHPKHKEGEAGKAKTTR